MRMLDILVAGQRALVPLNQVAQVFGDDLAARPNLIALAGVLGWAGGPPRMAFAQRNGPLWGVDAIGELLDLNDNRFYRLPKLLAQALPEGVWALVEIDGSFIPALDLTALAIPNLVVE